MCTHISAMFYFNLYLCLQLIGWYGKTTKAQSLVLGRYSLTGRARGRIPKPWIHSKNLKSAYSITLSIRIGTPAQTRAVKIFYCVRRKFKHPVKSLMNMKNGLFYNTLDEGTFDGHFRRCCWRDVKFRRLWDDRLIKHIT